MLKKFGLRIIRKEENKHHLRVIWYFLSLYKSKFAFLILLAAFIGVVESLNIALIYPIIFNGLSLNAEQNSSMILNFLSVLVKYIPVKDPLVGCCVLFIILAILAFIMKLFYFYFSVYLTSKMVLDTKQAIFDKCSNSDYQFFIDHKQGELLYNTVEAPKNVGGLLNILSSIFVELILSVTIFSVLLSMSWKLTVVIIIGGVGYYYLTKYLSLKIQYIAGRKQLESSQTETTIISEYTTGIKQIKVFETYSYWKDLFDGTLFTYRKYLRKSDFWSRFPEIFILFLLYISIGIAVIFIKLQYPTNFVNNLPVIGTFGVALLTIMPRLSKFGTYRMQLMASIPSVEVVHQILKDTSYNQIKNGDRKFTSLKSSMDIQNVTFAHKDRDILLKDVNMEIKKDRVTAVVGASGSGKSTIAHLLLRLHDVDSGGIYIDGVNIKEFDIYSFLRKVGYVSQDTFIFNASVKDNISFGCKYSDEEIIEATKIANAHEFIQKFPDKYNTLVGDRGTRLSGGEKQRIAIARAMIRKPDILILDEATSSLDTLSEKLVQQAINKVSKNCTTFIIAHRLSTIQNADIIYVIDNGKIVEKGKHLELIKKKGKYWELHNIQKI